MHNDTAYGLVDGPDEKGRYIVVTRKLLADLKPKDLCRIADDHLAAQLREATEGTSGKPFTNALVTAGRAIGPTGIQSVRLREPFKDKSLVIIEHGLNPKTGEPHRKAYKGDGNYCYDIFMGHKGKWAGEVITTFQAYQMGQETPDWWRKHVGREGQPLIMRLRKGDMVEIDTDNARKVIRIYEITPGTVIGYEHVEAVSSDRKKNDPSLVPYRRAPSSLQKLNAVCLSVSPSGKVRRHKA